MKKRFASVLKKTGANAFFGHLNKCRTKVLLYHSIVSKAEFDPSLDPADQCLTDEEFENQMSFISRNYSVISLDDFLHLKYDPAKPNIIITFDDGFRNNYAIAYPILKKYGLKAAFFITTSFVSGEELPWFLKVTGSAKKEMRRLPYEKFRERIAELSGKEFSESGWKKRYAYFRPMNWAEVRELSRDETVTIGSHCRTHHPLMMLPDEALRDDIAGSKALIEGSIEKPVDYISYPHGMLDERVIDVTKEAGYKAGLTTTHGFNDTDSDPYRLKRNEVGHRGDVNILAAILSGAWDFVKGSR